jgi:epoxyqueuosine reductase
VAQEARLQARAELVQPHLADLAKLTDAKFHALFRASPIKRIGRNRFIRNVLIAMGNSGDRSLAAEAERLLVDASPLVRAMAVWALSQLDPLRTDQIARQHLSTEDDPDVRAEWRAAISLSPAEAQ